MTVEYNPLIKLTFMSAVVEEIQLKLEGNVCAANSALWAYLEREIFFYLLKNKDDLHCYIMASKNYIINCYFCH